VKTVCSECHSQGKRIHPKLRCKKCNGRTVNRKRKILEVQIDKGMKEDGQKITFGGKGD
jgi:DnaJ-class molecular chaperone